MLRIQHVYEDKVENLLDQYKQQLEFYEHKFLKDNNKLTPMAFALKRDEDPVMNEILGVVAKIYEQSIPIALVVTDDGKAGPADLAGPGRSAGPRE